MTNPQVTGMYVRHTESPSPDHLARGRKRAKVTFALWIAAPVVYFTVFMTYLAVTSGAEVLGYVLPIFLYFVLPALLVAGALGGLVLWSLIRNDRPAGIGAGCLAGLAGLLTPIAGAMIISAMF